MTLEDKIREAAASGRLKALTLWRLNDGRYQANISSDRNAWTVQHGDDAVAALRKVFGAPVGTESAFD